MKKNYLILPIMVFLIGFLTLIPRFAYANDPIGMLQNVANQMVANLKQNKMTLKTHPTIVYSLSYKIIVPHADLDEMARRVLPPQTWGRASAGQKSEVKKELTTFLVRTYASALAQYSDETVRFFPIRGGYQNKTGVKVDSQIIRSQGPAIAVSYSVVNKGSQWKLFDMSVEGISMLESFRSQFADQLSRGDINALISTLRAHNNRNS